MSANDGVYKRWGLGQGLVRQVRNRNTSCATEAIDAMAVDYEVSSIAYSPHVLDRQERRSVVWYCANRTC
jgi:hypothetical protein